jgi:hypothetical protein
MQLDREGYEMTFWIDADTGFIVKHALIDKDRGVPGQSTEVIVDTFELAPPADSSLFKFIPPSDSTRK